MDGDAFPDFCTVKEVGLSCIRRDGAGAPDDFLRSMSTGLGSVSHVTYSLASTFSSNRIPFPLYVVSSIRSESASTNIGDNTLLSHKSQIVDRRLKYEHGYFHLRTREFRGFGAVEDSLVPTTGGIQRAARRTFHQGGSATLDAYGNQTFEDDAPLRGLESESSILDEGKIHRIVRTKYRDDSAPPFFTPAVEIAEYACAAGVCEAVPTRVTFEHDKFGNVVKESHFGDPSTDDDDFTIRRSFINNETRWILGLPSQESTYKGTATLKLAARTDTFYDDAGSSCGTIPTTTLQGTLGKGKPTRIQRWQSQGSTIQSRLGYDDLGNLVCASNANGGLWQFEYDTSTRSYRTATRNPLGRTLKSRYFGIQGTPSDSGSFGLKAEQSDANGATTSVRYDEFGRLLEQTFPDGFKRTLEYLDVGDPTKQRLRVSGSDGAQKVLWFDGMGRTWRDQTLVGDRDGMSQYTNYDEFGMPIKVSVAQFDSLQPLAWATTEFDSVGRVVRSASPNGSASQFCYGIRVSAVLDRRGRLTRKYVDRFGRTVRTEELTSDADPAMCSTSGGTPYSSISYDYDELGRLLSIESTDGDKTQYSYDDLGRVITKWNKNSGQQKLSYDDGGRLLKLASATKEEYFTYDATDRLVQKDYGSKKKPGKGDAVFTYDEETGAAGRLTSVRFGDWGAKYRYDSVGRILETKQTIRGRSYTISNTYTNGQLAKVVYPDGYSIFYNYKNNLLTGIRGSDGQVFAEYSDYNAQNSPKKIRYGGQLDLSIQYHDQSSIGCSNLNFKVCSESLIKDTPGAPQQVSSLHYEYEPSGEISAINNAASSAEVNFSYDQLGRIHTANGVTGSHEYSLSANGNISSTLVDGQETKYSYSSDAGLPFRLTAAGSKRFEFDPAGRLVRSYKVKSDGKISAGSEVKYQYGISGDLAKISGSSINDSFLYDVAGRRIYRSNGTIEEHFVSALFTCKSGLSGGRSCLKRVYAGGTLVAVLDDAGKATMRIPTTGQFKLFTLDKASGALSAALFQPYGAPQVSPSGAGPSSPMGLADSDYDPSTQLYYLGARFYDPAVGRFLTPDPVTATMDAADILNPYAYAWNNPISYADPTGDFPLAVVIGAVVGALMAGAASDWDLGAMIKGALIGGLSAGVGSWASGAVNGGLLGGAVGGAAASATAAIAYNQDPWKAAAVGFVSGGFGEAFSRAVSPTFGGMLAGGIGAAMYEEDVWSGIRWGMYGAMVAQLATSSTVAENDIVVGEGDNSGKRNGGLQNGSVYALKSDWTSRWWAGILGDPYSHVLLVSADGKVYDATFGEKSGLRSADLYKGRIATRVGSVANFNPSFAGRSYMFASDSLVCTQYVSASTNSQYTGFLPGQMYHGANASSTARNQYWWRAPVDEQR